MNSRKILRAAGLTLAGALGLWLFAAVLLPVLLPFLIGLAVAALVEKPVAALLRRTRIPRGHLCVCWRCTRRSGRGCSSFAGRCSVS